MLFYNCAIGLARLRAVFGGRKRNKVNADLEALSTSEP